ncbi:MAG: class I SAM-dependent methyltransferase [Candidatus Rokubacteria bacterium]|nr:class I SAM-dependent methyltransferase [Candidatus Rokubacteria bacterium]
MRAERSPREGGGRAEPGPEPAAAFDALASSYDLWYETPVGRLVDQPEKNAIFTLLEPRPGALALDLSCGTGNYALALAQRGFRVVGVDVSEPMLRVARAKARRGGIALALVRADGGALPFRAGAFDLVAILNRTGLWTLWRRLKRHFVRSVWRHAAFLGLGDLRRLLEEGGFRDLRWRGAVHFLPVSRRRGVRYLRGWETAGARWTPGLATFLAVTGRRG